MSDTDDSVVAEVLDEKSYESRIRDVRRDYDRQVGELRVSHKKHVYKREGIVQDRYERIVEDQRQSISERLDPLRTQLRITQEELHQEQLLSQRLRFQLMDAEKLVKDLEIDVARARAGLASESDESSSTNVAALRRKVERLRLNVLDQNEALSKAAKTKQDLETQNLELRTKLEESQLARSKAESLVKDLERRLTRKTEDLDAALKTRTADRAERENAVAELGRLQFSVQAKDEDVRSLSSSVEHSQHELRDTKEKFESIQQKLQADLKKERTLSLDLESKIRSLTSQLEREKKKVEVEQRQRKDAQTAAKKAKDQAEKWESKAEELEEEIAKLEKTIRVFDARTKI